jgi:hypothetical protein
MRLPLAFLVLAFPVLSLGVDTFSVHEVSFQAGAVYTNPYLQMSMTCTFRGPSGAGLTVLTTPGFWDGGDTWRCRVAPTVPGAWTYTTTSTDAGLDQQAGSFTVIENGAAGFIERDGVFDWKRSDGTQLFLMGDTCWRCLNTMRYSDAEFTAYINARSQQNFNVVRGYVMSQFRSSGDDTNDSGSAFADADTILPAYWREIDRRMTEANAAGIAWSLVVGSDGSLYEEYFSTASRRQRYLSMIIARYAAYNIIWDGVAEGQEHTSYLTLLRALGDYIAANDPYDHPRGQHPGQPPGDSSEWAGEPWLEYISYQSDKENHNQLIADRRFNLPLINEEFCYEFNCFTAQSSSHDCDSETTRKDAWRIAMAGAYFFGGNVGTYTGGSRPFAACALTDVGISDYAYIHDLFSTLPLNAMTPDNAITDNGGFVYRKVDDTYVVYQDDSFTANFTVDLSAAAGTFRARWLNPRTGAWIDLPPVGGGSTGEPFTRPDLQDWVLVLDRMAGSQLPPPAGVRRGESLLP